MAGIKGHRKTASFAGGSSGQSISIIHRSGVGLNTGISPYGYPEVELTGHFSRSVNQQGRVPLRTLRAFADTPPCAAAIERIASGVKAIPWQIEPPRDPWENRLDFQPSKADLKKAEGLRRALARPNQDIEGANTYKAVLHQIIKDLIVNLRAMVERSPGDMKNFDDDTPEKGSVIRRQAFWLRVIDPERIRLNLDWLPERSGIIPRYFDTGYSTKSDDWIPLMDADMFSLQRSTASYDLNPKSPLEIAFEIVVSWLGLSKFQQNTTAKAYNDYLIDIGPSTPVELNAFREFFEYEVVGRKRMPIFGSAEGGKGINVVKIGASTDEGLYLKYYEWIIRILALCFGLSARDFNVGEPSNRATSEVESGETFRYAIKPVADIIFEGLNNEVIDFYAPGFTISQGTSQARDELKMAQAATMLYEKNVAKLNEARINAGLPDLGDAGDVFKSEQDVSQEQKMTDAGGDPNADVDKNGQPPPDKPGNGKEAATTDAPDEKKKASKATTGRKEKVPARAGR